MMNNAITAGACAVPAKPPSIADELCSRAHRLSERAHEIAGRSENKLAAYSYPPTPGKEDPSSPRETYPDYFSGLRVALDNIEAALNRFESSINAAQL